MISNKISFTIATLLSLSLSPSCSKKSNSSSQPKQVCELATITLKSNNTQTITLSYDDQGRVVSAEKVDPGFSNIDNVYSYSGNTVAMTESQGGVPNSVDSVTLTSSGQIKTDRFISLLGGADELITYTFSGNQVQSLVAQDAGGNTVATETFAWSGGNLVSASVAFGGSTNTTTYSYNNQPAQTGDYWSEYQLIAFPVPYIKTANMLTSIASPNGTTSIFYSTDSTGRVTGLTESGSNPEIDTYQWSCH